MSGTPQVSTEKDGIFGRGMYIWDGSVFRKLLGSATGLILSGLRPASGYIPDQIDTIFIMSVSYPNEAAAFYDKSVFVVPDNKILKITQAYSIYVGGNVTGLASYVNNAGNFIVFNTASAPAAGVYTSAAATIYIDSNDNLRVQYTVNVLTTRTDFGFNGYIINKT